MRKTRKEQKLVKPKKTPKPLGLILAGGLSKRLFPVRTPKPLLKVRNRFLLQEALERLSGFDTFIVTNQEISKEIRKAFSKAKISIPQFIVEPEGRDTAAAVGFGIREATKLKKYSWVAVLSADTFMPESDEFKTFLLKVERAISMHPDALFVAGSLAKSKPAESYHQFGWIVPNQKNSSVDPTASDPSFEVERFVEKPSSQKLAELLSEGALINAGMFFGRAEVFLKAFAEHYPSVLHVTKSTYKTLERQPVDKAIFEKFESVRVVPLDLDWEDLGTWQDWHTHIGEGEAKRVDATDTFVYSESGLDVHLFGVKDLAIVESNGRLMIVSLSQARRLKDFLDR